METLSEESVATAAPQTDLYRSFIPGREGFFAKERLNPRGFGDQDVVSLTHLVLKPDGQFFASEFARIGPGTTKGDLESRRACILRSLLQFFPRAQIIDSGGTDASFHVVLVLDDKAADIFQSDPERVRRLLGTLRLIAFCDKVGDGMLSALSARAIGSTNSKTGQIVKEIQPETGNYAIEELEALAEAWLAEPEVSILRAWFGLHQEETCRCPFHDSKDADFKINDGLFCFGGDHCAAGKKAAPITMLATNKKNPSLASLLLSDSGYLKRWGCNFIESSRKFREQVQKEKDENVAAEVGKRLITVDDSRTNDAILSDVRSALSAIHNLFCDGAGRLISLEADCDSGVLGLVHHENVEKFISLVDRAAIIRFPCEDESRFGPMPRDRAAAIFHRPELRAGLRVLRRLSKNPVLDPENQRVLPPGYDPATKTYYDGPPLEPRLDGQTPVLDILLSGYTGFCGSPYRSCRTDRDVAHLYAAFFTEPLADSGLFTQHRHPTFRGNQKGLGKDKAGNALGVLRDGATPQDLQHYDEQRINQAFGNGIHDGRRIFQITNIECVKPYANPSLTRWITMEELSGAKHGGGTWRLAPNTATFVLTLNQGSIDTDLLDRLLLIDLETIGDARERVFEFDPANFVSEHHLEILSEVLGLCLLCMQEQVVWEAQQGTDVRFKKWMQVIGAMLKRRGLHGFMSRTDETAEEVDEDLGQFNRLALRAYTAKGNAWLRAKDLLPFCKTGAPGTADDSIIFGKVVSGPTPERKLAIYVLAPRVGKKVRLPDEEQQSPREIALEVDEDAKSKARKFRFELVSGVSGVSGDGGDGGDGGDAAGDPRPASPPCNPMPAEVVTALGGDSGDIPYTEDHIGSKQASPSSSSSVATPVTIPATPAIPAASTIPADTPPTRSDVVSEDRSDSWGGASL
ncbi:MAG: hypothetical protein HY291_23390 [Planctomycetes bacterium]|nr:hypothetical protein [Planctomycetota bacterium]